MFVRKVWEKDRKVAIVMAAILSLYLLLHLVKLEVFPLYLFPMYSLPKEAGKEQVVYTVKNKFGEEVDFSSMVYRRFVYIHNTLKAYDEVLESPNQRPDVTVPEKFVQRIGLEDHLIGKRLLDQYTVEDIDQKMQLWLSKVLEDNGPFHIDKCWHQWEAGKWKEKACKTINR